MAIKYKFIKGHSADKNEEINFKIDGRNGNREKNLLKKLEESVKIFQKNFITKKNNFFESVTNLFKI